MEEIMIITVKDKNGRMDDPSGTVRSITFVTKLPDGDYIWREEVSLIISNGEEDWDFSPVGAFELVPVGDINGRFVIMGDPSK
jgi:hypothetical protein